MQINLDVMQASFWSLAYVFFIIYSLKNKTHGISLISIVLNFSWETNALLADIINNVNNWIHIFWFSLDLIIIILALYYLRDKSKTILTLLSFICITVTLYFVFKIDYGMLVSCFIIDLIMAIDFHRYFNRTDLKVDLIYIMTAVCKFFGDMFAWLCYRNYTQIVNIIGGVVLFLNIYFLLLILDKYKNGIQQ